MTDHPNNGSIDPMSSEPSLLPRDPAPQHLPDFWARLDHTLGEEPSPVRPLGMLQDLPAKPKPWQSPMLIAAALVIVGLVGAVVLLSNRDSEPLEVFTDPAPLPTVVVAPAPTAIPTIGEALAPPPTVLALEPLPVPTPTGEPTFTPQPVLNGAPGLFLQDTPEGAYYLGLSDNLDSPCPLPDGVTQKYRVFFQPMGSTTAMPTQVETFHLHADIFRTISAERWVSYEMLPGDCTGSQLIIGELTAGVPSSVIATSPLHDPSSEGTTILSGLVMGYPAVTISVTNPSTGVLSVVQINVDTLEQTILRQLDPPGSTATVDPGADLTVGTDRLCEAGNLSPWQAGSVGLRMSDVSNSEDDLGLITVTYFNHGEENFDRAARWQHVVSDGSTLDQVIATYLTSPDSGVFDSLVRNRPDAAVLRADWAASITCETVLANTPAPLIPTNEYVSGPWSCSFDPELGINPLGMRAFVTIETANNGRVQWIYEQFGNAVGDGAGYTSVVFSPEEFETGQDAVDMLPVVADSIGLDLQIADELTSLMSCSRNPDFTSDGGWFDPTSIFPFNKETAESKALTFEVGNEGFSSFETESFNWFAYPDSGEPRCGALSYSIDVTDKQTGETATAITNIAADRIVSLTVREPDTGVLILTACGDEFELRMGWLETVGIMGAGPDDGGPPMVIELPGVADATNATINNFGTIRVESESGPGFVLDGQITDINGNDLTNLVLPLQSLTPNVLWLDDPVHGRRIYAGSTLGYQPGSCTGPVDSGAVWHLQAVRDDLNVVEYVGFVGADRPAVDIAAVSPDGSLLAVPIGSCNDPTATTINVYALSDEGAVLRSGISGDQLAPLFGGPYEIAEVRFTDDGTLAVTADMLGVGGSQVVIVDAVTN